MFQVARACHLCSSRQLGTLIPSIRWMESQRSDRTSIFRPNCHTNNKEHFPIVIICNDKRWKQSHLLRTKDSLYLKADLSTSTNTYPALAGKGIIHSSLLSISILLIFQHAFKTQQTHLKRQTGWYRHFRPSCISDCHRTANTDPGGYALSNPF